MILHESFSTALASAHRADLLADAERRRSLRHARAAAAAMRAVARRRSSESPPTTPAGNTDPERRYAMSR